MLLDFLVALAHLLTIGLIISMAVLPQLLDFTLTCRPSKTERPTRAVRSSKR